MSEAARDGGRSRAMRRDPRFAVALLVLGAVVFLGGVGAFGGGATAPIVQQPFVDGFDESLFGQPGRRQDGAIELDLLEVYGSADGTGDHADPFSRRG